MAREDEAYEISETYPLSIIRKIIRNYDKTLLESMSSDEHEEELRDTAFEILTNFPDSIDRYKR